MKIGIGYAAYFSKPEHFRYARETLESVKSEEHEIKFCGVVNHSNRHEYIDYLEDKGKVLSNHENNVSMAWNRAMDYLLDTGCDYVIVPNLDIVFKSTLVDNLVRYANRGPDDILLWTALPWGELESLEQAIELDHAPETPHFSCFMVDNRVRRLVGGFDENFVPAYNEDIDMHWRIVLKGKKAVGYEGARFFHYGSRTIKEDQALLEQNHITHDRNNKYFERKWGYKPPTATDPFHTDQMFRTPFNRGW